MWGDLKWRSVLETLLTTLVASPIFIQSFGRSLLGKTHATAASPHSSDDYEAESKLIYLGSSICGQLGYSLFSSLNGGFFIFPTFENSIISARIHRTCMEHNPNGFVNTLLCFFLASQFTAAAAFALSSLRLGELLRFIPMTVVIVTMVTSGTQLFLLGCSLFIVPSTAGSGILVLCSVLITFGLLLLLKKYKNPRLMLYYVLGLVGVMNLARLVAPLERLYSWRLFVEPPAEQLSVCRLLGKVHPGALDISVLSQTWADVISMGLFPLIPFAVNLPIYASGLDIDFDGGKELAAFGFSNLFSSLSFYPTYFNCSGSMLFHLCGNNTRMHSLLAGAAMAVLYFCFRNAVEIMPTFAVSLLLQFVGLSFLQCYIPMVCRARLADMLVVVGLIACNLYFSLGTIQILLLCLLASAIVTALQMRTIYYRSSAVTLDDKAGALIIKVAGRLTFYNVAEVLSRIKGTEKPCVLSLEKCDYVDMTANFEIHKAAALSRRNGRAFRFMGQPRNFYVHLYEETDFAAPGCDGGRAFPD